MKRVLGIVPAREGSKRIPRKNVRVLGGRPLVAWAIEAARAAGRLTRIVVSSDDREVLDIASRFGDVLPLWRPPELATDTSPAIDFVTHALATLRSSGEAPFEATAIIQPSSPFTLPEDIDRVVELLARTAADSAVTVMQVEHALHPIKLKRLDGDRLLPFVEDERGRMAEHDLPKLYVRNGSVYATRLATIERGSILGDDSRAWVMPRDRSIDINDELDLQFAEFLLERRSRREPTAAEGTHGRTTD